MPLTDLPLSDCLDYRPELPVPEDFERFWATTLDESVPVDTAPTFTPVATGLTQVDTYDVAFAGFDGHPVRGWLHLPAGAAQPLGCVVEYLGYSRGRGMPHEKLFWASAGYAHLIMDTRGQGWGTADSATPDPGNPGVAAVPGLMTRGIGDPATYYYRRLYVDAVRCVEAARSHPAVDAERVVVTGASQGGGMSLAVAGLVPGLAGVMADVPFLCHFRRGTEVAARGPYPEIVEYLATNRGQTERVFRTLSYFDAAILAGRATAPALVSVAMMDDICPPSTCFAAYNNYAGPKEYRVYEFNNHEGGDAHQQAEQLTWTRKLLG